MFTVTRGVGRVVDVRVESLKTVTDADNFVNAVRNGVLQTAPAQAVICADHRAVRIYPQEVAERLIFLFNSVNPHIERAGLVVARTNATFSIQIERIVRESLNPQRRVFYEPDALIAWLSEILTDAEAAHIRAFLSANALSPNASARRGSERPGSA